MNAAVETNTTVANPFASMTIHKVSATEQSSTAREISEVQAAMVIAKRFPRDPVVAMDRIIQACTRPGLAESAVYQYSRGGSDVTGPSIRLAEALAQNWGNVTFGIRELSQSAGESTVEAFAHDLETNTRQVKVFQVPHIRYTRQGTKRLEDPRDVYEMVANQGARRLRACILGVIPGDVIDAALKQCDITLNTKAEVTPERIKAMLETFAGWGVTREMLEAYIQRSLDAITPALFVRLGKVANSIRDGMAKPQDIFHAPASADAEEAKPASGAEAAKAAIGRRRGAPADRPADAPISSEPQS